MITGATRTLIEIVVYFFVVYFFVVYFFVRLKWINFRSFYWFISMNFHCNLLHSSCSFREKWSLFKSNVFKWNFREFNIAIRSHCFCLQIPLFKISNWKIIGVDGARGREKQDESFPIHYFILFLFSFALLILKIYWFLCIRDNWESNVFQWFFSLCRDTT